MKKSALFQVLMLSSFLIILAFSKTTIAGVGIVEQPHDKYGIPESAYGEPVSGYGYPYNLVKKVQKALKAKGYDPGPIDGAWGSKTKRALMEFQRDNGLEPNGKIELEIREILFD